MLRILSAILTLFCLVGLVKTQNWIDDFHAKEPLNQSINNADIPATLAVTTVALGPLRSLVVNVLWFRAIQQQDKGEYFDALQLAEWITKLQPTNASVWSYLAWNMAYNVAHDFANPEDRWQWISRGIRLLRDEGLRYNPNNRIIRQELARIYYHRIGGKIDPAAEYLKNQWAFLMMNYFDRGDRNELEKLQRAAETVEELRSRDGVSEYYNAVLESGIDLLDFDSNKPQRGWHNVDLPLQVKVRAAWEIYYHYKRLAIEEELKLEIDQLIYIDEQYGPFDWRLHQAHAIYWAAEENFEDFMKGSIGGVNYGVVVRQAMISSFYEGRLSYNQEKNTIIRTNNLRIIGRIHDYFDFFVENSPSSAVDNLHREFLEQAVTILYSFNHLKESKTLFKHYKDDYLKDRNLTFEDFVVTNMEKSLSDSKRNTGRSLVDAALYKSFESINNGELDRSNGFYNLAKQLWLRHQKKYEARSPAKLLPPFAQLVAAAKRELIASANITDDAFEVALEKAQQRSTDPVYIGDANRRHKRQSVEIND